MRKLLALAAVVVMFSGLTALAADEGKKVTIEGDAVCGKCALHETKSCQNVVIVKKDGKETKYFLAKNDAAKKAHGKLGICKASKDEPIKVKVTGICTEEDGKHIITASKIEKDDD